MSHSLFSPFAAVVITTAVFASAVQAQSSASRQSLAERVARLEQQSYAGSGSDDGTMLEMLNRLDQMRSELRDLRGLVEEQTFEIEGLKRRQRDQYLDVDRRLQAAESGNSAINTAQLPSTAVRFSQPSPVQTQGIGERAQFSRDEPELRSPIDAQIQSTALAGNQRPVANTLGDPVAEKRAYESAFADLKDGRYADAAESFTQFLKLFPVGDYTDNAQYWLGESFYVTRNYRIALDSFQKLINQFPGSTKVPDALLKIGYTYYELAQWVEARTTLEKVSKDYAGTTVARLAQGRLRAMRLEGH